MHARPCLRRVRQKVLRRSNDTFCPLVPPPRSFHLPLQFPGQSAIEPKSGHSKTTHLTCSSRCLARSFPPCFSVLIFSPAIRSLFSYSLTLAAHLSSTWPARPCCSASLSSSRANCLAAFEARFSADKARSVNDRICDESVDEEPARREDNCWDSSAFRAY
jgi:hypothetical protein